MNRIGLIGLIAALACGTAAQAAGNLVANGDFEANPADGTSIVDWTVTGNGVADDQVFFNSPTHDVVFNGSSADPSNGVLSQDIATTAGAAYKLNFQLLSESGWFGDSFTVTFGGFSTTISGDQAAAAYTPEQFSILGSQVTGPTTTLSFQGGIDPQSATQAPWNLDDVSLTAAGGVPEPAAWALMLSGFFAVGAMIRSRRGTLAPAR
jgi:hypothetical protein